MRIVVAPDKFKGSLDAAAVASHLSRGIRDALPDARVTTVPMADGGEGTLEAALANGYERRDVIVHGPLGTAVRAAFGLRNQDAIVELAAASGLALAPEDGRDALAATSRGTGELILAALDAGARRIVLAIGGSASTDGGAGLLAALGARLRDAGGAEIADGGGALRELASVDLSGLDPRLTRTAFVLACDVDNVLLGPAGAAAVFGPQKGADPSQVSALEAGVAGFARALRWALRIPNDDGDRLGAGEGGHGMRHEGDPALLPGAGAAGGVGFAAYAVLRAERRPGVDVVVDTVGLREHLASADLCITGEGSLDEQSLGGKTPIGVARAARALGVPVIAVCGRTTLAEDAWRRAGFVGCYTLTDRAPDAETSMREAERLLVGIGREIAARLGPLSG